MQENECTVAAEPLGAVFWSSVSAVLVDWENTAVHPLTTKLSSTLNRLYTNRFFRELEVRIKRVQDEQYTRRMVV